MRNEKAYLKLEFRDGKKGKKAALVEDHRQRKQAGGELSRSLATLVAERYHLRDISRAPQEYRTTHEEPSAPSPWQIVGSVLILNYQTCGLARTFVFWHQECFYPR